MKRIIKKILMILIIFIIVFEFSFSNTSFAAVKLNMVETVNSITNLCGGIVSIIFWIPRLIIVGVTVILNKTLGEIIKSGGSTTGNNDGSFFLTPFDIFFNNYEILGINFFDVDSSYSSLIYGLRKSVSIWFYALRMISSVILLIILIYVGIRMALSTVAEDQAKYKKMLIDWCCSLALIFLLQYIAIAVIYLNNAIVDAFRKIFTNADSVDISQIMNDFLSNAVVGIGISSMVSTAVLVLITAQSALYFIAYLKRVVTVGFLIIISPLISITYSIDKMGDGKAQALNNWLKEFIYTILIQPFHCIIYIAFVNTAFSLVNATKIDSITSITGFNQFATGILVIACLLFINSAEKVVRKIFGFSNGNGKTALATGAIMAGATVGAISKAGSVTRKGINTFSKFTGNLATAVKSDGSKFMNGPGSKISSVLKGAGKLASKIPVGPAGKLGNIAKAGSALSKIAGKAKKGINGAKTLHGRFKSKMNSLKNMYKNSKLKGFVRYAKPRLKRDTARALRVMGTVMALASGESDLVTANAVGAAVQSSTEDFFDSSKGTIADKSVDSNQRLDDAEHKKYSEQLEDTRGKLESAGLSADATKDDVDEYRERKLNDSKHKKTKKKFESSKENNENAKKALKDAENRLKEAEAEQAKAKTEAEKQNAQKKINQYKNEVENSRKAKEMTDKELEKASKKYQEEMDIIDKECQELNNTILRRDELQNKLDNFYTDSAILSRVKARQYGPRNSDTKKARNQIIQSLMDFKRKNNEVSSSSETSLFEKSEMDQISKEATFVAQNVDLSVLKEGFIQKFDSEEDYAGYILECIGIADDGSDQYKRLSSAVISYQLLKDAENVANGYAANSNVGGNNDTLAKKEAKRIRRRPYAATNHNTSRGTLTGTKSSRRNNRENTDSQKARNQVTRLMADFLKKKSELDNSFENGSLDEKDLDNVIQEATNLTQDVEEELNKEHFPKFDSEEDFARYILDSIGIKDDGSEEYKKLNSAIQSYRQIKSNTTNGDTGDSNSDKNDD